MGVEKVVPLLDDVALAAMSANRHAPADGGDNHHVDAPGWLRAMEKPLGVVDSIGNYAVHGQIFADMALPALSFIPHWTGFKKTTDALMAPKNFLHGTRVNGAKIAKDDKGHFVDSKHSIGSAIMDGSFVIQNAIGGYHVALSYFDKQTALRTMCAEIMNVNPKDIALSWLMSSNQVPPIIQEARSHITKEHVMRGAVAVLGTGWNLRNLLKGGVNGLLPNLAAGMVPQFLGQGVDMVMGQSPVEPFAEAYKSWQVFKQTNALPEDLPHAYVRLLEAVAYPQLKQYGGAAKTELAQHLVMKYVNENISPGEALRRITNHQGADFIKDIQSVLPKAQEEHTKAAAERKAKAEEAKRRAEYAKTHGGKLMPKAHAQPAVVTIPASQPLAHRPVVGDGKYTGLLHKQAETAAAQHMAPGVA